MSLIHYGHLQRSFYLALPTASKHEFVWDCEISNCSGLSIGTRRESSLYLRTGTEMRCAADWLRTLWDNPLPLLLKGVSPEFAYESIPDAWDATDLELNCWKTRGLNPKLHIGSTRPYQGAIILHSKEATIAFSEAMAELAELFEDPESNLFVSDIPTPATQS